MKQFSIIITICILASCSKHNTQQVIHTSLITVVHDITDSLGCIPTPDPILALYDFQNDKELAAGFRIVLISDKKLNPAEEIHIENGTKSEQGNVNEEIDYREQLVNSFYDVLRTAVNDFHKQYAPGNSLNHSQCFATISSELGLLFTNTATQKILIVYSDLQENTDVFSCYTKDGRSLLQANPGRVARLLQKHCPLPANLVGITVYFVYQPLSRGQDTRFGQMVAIYKDLLKSRGARVVIQATNKYYTP